MLDKSEALKKVKAKPVEEIVIDMMLSSYIANTRELMLTGKYDASFDGRYLKLCPKSMNHQPIARDVKVTITSRKVDETIRILKSNEPTSDNEFFRTNIIMYEFGDLCRAIVYAHRFKDSDKVMFRDGFKSKQTILAEGKLAMADLLTQLHMLCISMEWDFDNLQEIGSQHLAERQQDFKRDRWSEVKL